MDQITNALLLKEEASRGSVAVTYAVVGLLVGVLIFNKKSA